MSSSGIWTMLAVVALGAAAIVLGRRAVQRKTSPHAAAAPASASYHCVELRLRGDVCKRAVELGGVRFLAVEAPQLPLPGCTGRCACSYRHFPDRRREDRRGVRVNEIYLNASSHGERRAGRSRRKTDRSRSGPR